MMAYVLERREFSGHFAYLSASNDAMASSLGVSFGLGV